MSFPSSFLSKDGGGDDTFTAGKKLQCRTDREITEAKPRTTAHVMEKTQADSLAHAPSESDHRRHPQQRGGQCIDIFIFDLCVPGHMSSSPIDYVVY